MNLTRLLQTSLIAAATTSGGFAAPATSGPAAPPFKQFCFGCHGKAAMGGLNLEQLSSKASIGEDFQHWEKVVAALEQKRMPPKQMPQPSDADRQGAIKWIRTRLGEYAAKHAGDPGKVTVRRLTSGEYAYSIRDLTGLDWKIDGESGTDSVGGEGFTNYGDVQFMADASLEQYLESAKKVADHAVIGAGPLQFFDDPGKSGFELSAIHRINSIYRANGFRTNSGEGGKPYGLERYTKVFFVAWRYKHRAALGEPKATLQSIAVREGISGRFAEHVWKVLQDATPTYPTSSIAAKWNAIPAPSADREKSLAAGRSGADQVMQAVIAWPKWLFATGAAAEGGQGDERSIVMTEESLKVTPKHKFRFFVRGGRGQKSAKVFMSVEPANGATGEKPVVIWRNAMFRVRGRDRAAGEAKPLRAVLDEATIQRLGFGKLPDGTAIDTNDFATTGSVSFDVAVPEGAFAGGLEIDAELAPGTSGNTVLRCVLSDTEDVTKGRPSWALLGDPKSPGFLSWRDGVIEFANALPLNSQGEATPSDKDPIPEPFNNVYNQPERDHFHVKAKYYRTDQFLVDHVLDDATRAKLDHAWNDLLSSFEYYDVLLRFTSDKLKLNLKKTVAQLEDADVEAIPVEARKYVKQIRADYLAVQQAQLAGRPKHLDDAMRFAAKAWRRPLSDTEKDRLRAFYVKLTETDKLEHGKAIETLLSRVLVSPAFLYRLEQPAKDAGVKPLSNFELANRLSYFLWSSVPDEELRRAAAAGELTTGPQLEKQVKRMLADPKARRFATEFFGQWLGFYRFDRYRGVDTTRFPEFTDEVKSAMYDEAIAFFEHIVRKDRPVSEILHANYTFVNKPLAKHYGIKKEVKSVREPELVEGANEYQRGGLLRLGAVLTATSAPLRTSPVKRGDWVLRRILGTPTPPPPADAGSIPADDKLFGGMTVFERLEAHKRNPTCASCHVRIDPLGFPLEKFDSVGRFRQTYSDGKAIRDNAELADQTPVAGVEGLLAYLKTQEPQVLKTMSYKLLGYALGRTVIVSDQPLVEKLTKAGGDTTMSKLISEIVNSKQFRYRRERDETSAAPGVRQGEPKAGGD